MTLRPSVPKFRTCGRFGNLNTVIDFLSICVCFVLSMTSVLNHVISQSFSQSLSPFNCMLHNFSDFRKEAARFGFQVKSPKLCSMCELESPSSSGINWPSKGYFKLNCAYSSHKVCNSDHLDQHPHTVTLVVLLENP